MDEEYDDTSNDIENYEYDNDKNKQNKETSVDDGSNDTKDVNAHYNKEEETRNDSTKETVRYDANARSIGDNFVPLKV